MSQDHALKTAFWEALSDSPFVMLELDGHPEGVAPMTAQLDRDANSAIWFFTSRNGHFAPLGAANATFSSKDHKIFARFGGHLVEEQNPAVKDKFWSNAIEGWFPGGKNSPEVLLMRLDLGEATIWGGDLGLIDSIKLMLGADVRDKMSDKLETHL